MVARLCTIGADGETLIGAARHGSRQCSCRQPLRRRCFRFARLNDATHGVGCLGGPARWAAGEAGGAETISDYLRGSKSWEFAASWSAWPTTPILPFARKPRQCPRNSAREPAIEVPSARPLGRTEAQLSADAATFLINNGPKPLPVGEVEWRGDSSGTKPYGRPRAAAGGETVVT